MPLPRRALHPSSRAHAAITAVARRLEPASEMADWYRDYVRHHAERLALDVDLVRAVADGPVLDIGSTPPLVVAALADDGYDVAGVDIAPERFPTALDIRRCDIEREALPFDDATFSVVLFNELLEHLRIDPIHALREARRVLTPTGHLMISTPNARSVEGIWNFLVRRRVGWCQLDVFEQYGKLERLGHMGHVREYTFVEVRELLHHLEMDVVHTVWRGDRPGVAHRLDRLIPTLSPFMTLVVCR